MTPSSSSQTIYSEEKLPLFEKIPRPFIFFWINLLKVGFDFSIVGGNSATSKQNEESDMFASYTGMIAYKILIH